MSALNNSALIGASGSTGYLISRSVRLRSSASAYFNRTPAGAPTSTQKFTQSYWLKRGALGTTQYLYNCEPSDWVRAYIFSDNIFYLDIRVSGTNYSVGTTQVFRDPSAYYHILVSVDTTQVTAANRVTIYVNGVQAATSTPTIPQNSATVANSANANFIGAYRTPNQYFDGYLTEINFIDGQALTPSSFGAYNAYGVWSPMKYNGAYGNNGFYLNFSDNSAATAAAIGKDYSGNGNNWTPNNISVTSGVTYDSMLDVPTPWPDGGNGRGNYATLNPLTGGSSTTSDGNLAATIAPVNGARVSTIAVTSGKWYCEMVATTVAGYFVMGIGAPYSKGWDTTQESNPNSITWATSGAGSPYVQSKGSWTFSSNTISTTYAANDVVGIALDLDNNTLAFYKNGVSQGSMTINTQGTPVSFLIGNSSGASNGAGYVNFGQRPFAYTPPSGFRALNTQNLPTPTILKGNQFFDATTYTGTGANQNIVNSGAMQPDLVWIKSRSAATNNRLVDSVRGNNYLVSNSTAAEVASGTMLIQSNGFLVGTDSDINTNAATYVGWQWKAGGTPAVTNTAGSITSTVSAGATQGFSVVTYTGTGANATVGHGLGVAPRMIIVKSRSLATSWPVYHASLTAAGRVFLDGTNAYAADSAWNSTAPTSSVFSIGPTGFSTNNSGQTYVAYCFAAIAGFSAFGSYTGNGSADGPFIFTGFRPAFVMVKSSSAVNNWNIYDDQRPTYNQSRQPLYANLSAVEPTAGLAIDLLSNGFKWREAGGQGNDSGQTYIFAAFAENPFKYSLAR